jgi:hypothetical protein
VPNRHGLEFWAQFDKNSLRKIGSISCREAVGYTG